MQDSRFSIALQALATGRAGFSLDNPKGLLLDGPAGRRRNGRGILMERTFEGFSR
jgi:hypothetical protein